MEIFDNLGWVCLGMAAGVIVTFVFQLIFKKAPPLTNPDKAKG